MLLPLEKVKEKIDNMLLETKMKSNLFITNWINEKEIEITVLYEDIDSHWEDLLPLSIELKFDTVALQCHYFNEIHKHLCQSYDIDADNSDASHIEYLI